MTAVMSLRRLGFPAVLSATVLMASQAAAQTPIDDPLDARDARRVDRMEKVVRELRSIVYQFRDTRQPVVVQPADTDARLESLLALLQTAGGFEPLALCDRRYDLDRPIERDGYAGDLVAVFRRA